MTEIVPKITIFAIWILTILFLIVIGALIF